MNALFIKNSYSNTLGSFRYLSNFTSKQANYIALGLLLLLGIGIRIWFWHVTHLALEDALITFRYAENIASGNGFVYNTTERVLGTTTPLWTLMLAGAKLIGANLFTASKVLSILLDAATCFLLFSVMRPHSVRAAGICAVLFATSPAVIPLTISGMETSLLLCSMSLALMGYVRKNSLFGVGLALTILTRTDGVLYATVFVGMGILGDRRWLLRQLIILCLCCLPWYIFSIAYFGNILPQSLLAKRAMYSLSLKASAEPFINSFSPFLDSHPLKILVKSVLLVLLGTGITLLFRRGSIFLPVGIFFCLYCAAFVMSGAFIFNWYLAPPIFISYIILAVALDWYISQVHNYASHKVARAALLSTFLFAIILLNISIVRERGEKYGQLQKFEEEVRQTIGVWLKIHATPGSKVLLEPIGYIGYFAGPELNIQDEIGLVNPKVVECKKASVEWYTQTIRALKPDYIVQYAASLQNNKAEGTGAALFNSDSEREWFFSHFHTVTTVEATGTYSFIEQKEKKYVIFKRSDKTL